MEGRVLKAYRRSATLTGLTLLMVYLASCQHFLSSAISYFIHFSFSLVTWRYKAFSLTSVTCFSTLFFVCLSLNLTFSTRPFLFCFLALHCIKFDLCLLFSPLCQLPFLFLCSFISPSLPLPNWCLSVCLLSDQERRRLTLPGLGNPVVQ